MTLTADEERQAREWQSMCPYRLIFVARKDGEPTVVSAVTSKRIPNRLAREGWTVALVTRA